MKGRHIGLLMAVGLGVTLAAAQPAGPAGKGKVTVEVISLEVTKSLPAAKRKLARFGSEGTEINLLISLPSRYVIAMDWATCKLQQFTDDKKTDLSKSRSWGSRPGWIGPFSPRISKDGKDCIVKIKSGLIPASGASKIILKGQLGLKCGAELKTATQTGVVLKAGSTITAGPVPMKIASVKEGGWGGAKMTVTVTSTKPAVAIKTIAFLGADGKAIKHEVLSSGSSGRPGSMTYETNFGLARKVDRVSVKIEYFSKVVAAKVPLDLRVSVGL